MTIQPTKLCTLLTDNHDEVRSLLHALQAADCSGQPELIHRVASQLIAHLVAERDVLYPSLDGSAIALVMQGLDRHTWIRFALDDLVHANCTGNACVIKIFHAAKALSELVDTHALHAQRLFALADMQLGAQLTYLSGIIARLFQRARTSFGVAETTSPVQWSSNAATATRAGLA